jgi:hypothetical protein
VIANISWGSKQVVVSEHAQGYKEGGQTTPKWNAWASSCMQKCIVMDEHYEYAGYQHSTPLFSVALQSFFLAFCNSLHDLVVPLLHELHHQHLFTIPEISCHQLSSGQTTVLCSCLVNMCASTALSGFWFQHSQMKPRFHCLLLIRCDWEIHCHLCDILKKSTKAKAIPCVSCLHWGFFRIHLCRKLAVV